MVQGAGLNRLEQWERGHRHPLPKAVVQVRNELVELTELVALVLVHRQHFALIRREGLRHDELNFFQLTNALFQVVIHPRFQDEGQIKIVLENVCAFKLGHVLGTEKAHPFIAESVIGFELCLVVVKVRPHRQARAGGLGHTQEKAVQPIVLVLQYLVAGHFKGQALCFDDEGHSPIFKRHDCVSDVVVIRGELFLTRELFF